MGPKLGRLSFGKHTGKLLSDIAKTDPAYLHWLLEQDWLQRHHRILICKALEIDETLLIPTPKASIQSYARRIDRTIVPESKKIEKADA